MSLHKYTLIHKGLRLLRPHHVV